MKYRSDIDGLRALAVLPVILYHAGFDWFSGGFVGVDVFFVISGYLIATIIISEIAEENFSLIDFYERRSRRILPALFFVMFVCLPFSWLWLTPSDLKDFGESLIFVSTFSSNFFFWLESGYFNSSVELKPLIHTWSLAVEEQYYILFPVFLMLTWRLGVSWVLSLLALVFVVSLGIAHWAITSSDSEMISSGSFYLLPSRGWELLIGVFVAFYFRHSGFLKSQWVNNTLSLIGFGLICYSVFTFDQSTPFPGLYALIPTLGTGLLIATTAPNTLVYRILSWAPFVTIGLFSYSAYLWHQPILSFARHRMLGDLTDLWLLALSLLSLLFGYISWRWIETPFRNKSVTTKKFIFVFSAIGILVFSMLGALIQSNDGFNERVSFDQNLINSFDRPKNLNCFDLPISDDPEEWGCNLGSYKEDIDFILFGDSHSASLINVVDEVAKSKGLRIFYAGKSGCIPFIEIYSKSSSENNNNCFFLNEKVSEFARAIKPRGIIFSARWAYYNFGDYGGDSRGVNYISSSENGPFNQLESMKSFNVGLSNTVNFYRDINIPIHIISQPPHQKYLPESVYFSSYKGRSDIEAMAVKRTEFDKMESFPKSAFLARADDINFHYIAELFCDDKKCPIGTDEVSFYFDDNHLSVAGAEKLRDLFRGILITN